MFPRGKLLVWRRSRALAVGILAHRGLESSGAGRDIASQLRRATLSVGANIAEGAGSESHAMFARYLGIALASASEVAALIEMAQDARLIDAQTADAWGRETREIAAMLYVLRRRVASDPRGRRRPGRTSGA